MRRFAVLTALALFTTAIPLPAAADPDPLQHLTKDAEKTVTKLIRKDPNVGDTSVPGGFTSPNLEYVGTLPNESPGVGARVLTVGDQKRLYVSSVQGLSIYDVTKPAAPVLLGHLELAHWENEDITVSRDGRTVLMSEFTGTYMHVIQILDGPAGTLVPVPQGFTAGPSGHIVDCIDAACDWVYGSEGVIIDLRDKSNPVIREENWARMNGLPTNGHNVNFDASGLLWTDTTPIAALDVSDPLNPVAVVKGDKVVQTSNRTAYQHNNIRPNADLYQPRKGAQTGATDLRAGELLMGNGETNFTGTCNSGSGPFATYKITDMTPGTTDALEFVDVLRPVSGQYADGDPAVNTLGCSGHWFSIQPSDIAGDTAPATYDVAAAWYEHGTRLLSVDAATGKITQRGFFQPVVGSASAAHWIDDEYIYVVDYERGIDVLRYDASAPAPSVAEIDESWLAKLHVKSAVAQQERYLCRLVTQD
jgi:hypothetical protein